MKTDYVFLCGVMWTQFVERDARPELVQCIHCNGPQFRSAVLHLLGHFGIWRAFVMLSEQ
jgi:hypothetical protein